MRVRLVTTALAGVVLVSLLAGCSDDKDPGGDDPTSAAPTGTASATSPDPSDPTSESSTTVEPAAGPEIHLPSAADFHLTEGLDWDITDNGAPLVLTNAPVEGALANVRIDSSEFAQIGDDLALAAKVSAENQAARYSSTLHVAGYRDLKGVRGFVLEGKGPGFNYYEWGGLDADNAMVVVTFMIPVELKVEDYVEPVLASFEWRS